MRLPRLAGTMLSRREPIGPMDIRCSLFSTRNELNPPGLNIFRTVCVHLLRVDVKASVLLALGTAVNAQTAACRKVDDKQPNVYIGTQIVMQRIALDGCRADVKCSLVVGHHEPGRPG